MAYLSKFVILLAGVFIILSSTTSNAQNIKIAVVDIDKVLSTSKAGKSVEQQLKTRREAFQKEFTAREDGLTASQKALVKQKADLTPEEFAAKRKEFEKQLLETRNLFQKRRNSLDKGLGNALAALRKNIIQVTAEVANEKNYQIVLTRDSVVIAEKEIDITDIVLNRLNTTVSNIPLDLK